MIVLACFILVVVVWFSIYQLKSDLIANYNYKLYKEIMKDCDFEVQELKNLKANYIEEYNATHTDNFSPYERGIQTRRIDNEITRIKKAYKKEYEKRKK